MAWQKSPPSLVAFIEEVVEPFEAVRKMMFGYPAYFVNNNLWAALHQDDFIVRLSKPDLEEIKSGDDPAKAFEPLAGRQMKEYVCLPASILDDGDALAEWLRRSHDFVSALPPKEPKPKRAKKNKS